jgi:hypothetical protein
VTPRQIAGVVIGGLIWTVGMAWWYGDFGTPKMAVWVVGGALFAAAWAWCMKRWVW